MTPLRVLVTNWESADNLGDYAILRAQVGLLEGRLGASVRILGNQPGVVLPAELEPRHCCDSPWVSPWRGGTRAWAGGLARSLLVLAWPPSSGFLDGGFSQLVRLLAAADLVMPKGGGYLLTDGSARKSLFLARSLLPLLLARRLGVHRALLGHSIGPVKGWPGRALLKTALRGAQIVVRDDASLRVCRDLGLPADRAPDLALLTVPPAGKGRHHDASRGRITRIGVTARRVSADGHTQDRFVRAVAEAVALIAAEVADSGRVARVHLIPQVVGPTPLEDDRPVLNELAGRLGAVECVQEDQPADLAAALGTYARLDFLLATRMHSAILSACVGTPFTVFGYVGGKAAGMVRDLGLPAWTSTDRIEEIPATALRCYRERDSLRAEIARGLPEARERLYRVRLAGPPAFRVCSDIARTRRASSAAGRLARPHRSPP